MSTTTSDITPAITAPPKATVTATIPDPLPTAAPSKGRLRVRSSWLSLAAGSINRRIFAATVVIAVVTLIVKFGGLAKEMVVAWRFGTSDELDAFNVALAIPFALVNIAAIPFQTAFLPAYVQTRQHAGTAAAQEFFASSILWLWGAFVGATMLLVLSGPLYLPYLARGFTPEKLHLTFQLLCLIAPMILLVGTSFLLAGMLNVENSFALPAITPLFTALLSILFLVLAKGLGVYALALAVTMGATLEVVILGLNLQQKGISLRPRWRAMSAQLRQVVGNSFALMLGHLLMAGTTVIGIAVASRLSAGSVSSLSYANKMTALSTGLIASSLGTATISFFAQMSAKEDWQGLKNSLRHFLGLAFLLTFPLACFVMLFATPLTRLLFKRGAFAADDVAAVAELIFYLALQIPFYVTNVLIAKIFLALQTPRIILYGSAINLVVYAVLVYLLAEKLGLVGIAIATSVTYFCSFLILFGLADRKLNQLLNQSGKR